MLPTHWLRTAAKSALILGIATGIHTLPAPAEAVAGPMAPTEPQRSWLKPGAELVAVKDVELREAHLMKGTKVRVVEVAEKSGRVDSVSLELPDGHVLHQVSANAVRTNFAPAKKKVKQLPPKRK